jgi:hypothetical protein
MLEVFYAIGGWDERIGEPVLGSVKIGDAFSLREANRLARRLYAEWWRRHGPGEVVVTQTRVREVDGRERLHVERVPEAFLAEVDALVRRDFSPSWLR